MAKLQLPAKAKYEIVEAEFVVSNTDVARCPDDGRNEYAFIGRSNVGKSSLINMLCKRRKLALTSARPGKTMLINHFLVNKSWYIVDLPGYGYAKRSKTDIAKLGSIISSYIDRRRQLTCLFVLVDSRIPPQPVDVEFINSVGAKGIPIAIVFTKADRPADVKFNPNIEAMKAELSKTWEELPPVFVTSSLRKTGREELLKYIYRINVSLKTQNK